ncbi:MAG: SprT-like domain-containing protein [Methylococcales bacterium]
MRPTPETYSEWQMAYDFINQNLFKDELPACLITFQREKNSMGYFSQERFANRSGNKTDEIALNPAFFAVTGMNDALSTLAHEMCHLWQFHFGKPGRGRYHNREWAKKMINIGLMPSSTGLEGGDKTGDQMNDYIIMGGVFERCIIDLSGKGFKLQWMDRFIAKPTNIVELSTKIKDLENADDDVIASEMGMEQALIDVLEADFGRIKKPKLGNRSKYTCTICEINLWAKPDLLVICGECNEPFEEI